tara:strand:- start:430 stop:1005 length:576 start_codon:yes stop_codon:yes gene_type:complete
MRKSMNQYNLKGIYEEIWDYLDVAVKDRKSGFHTFSLATISNGYPDNRTVVLRGCCKKTMKLSFHTNNFSNKIIDISAEHNVSALFYDKEKKIQIRIAGIANINNDNSYCKEKWENMSNQSKECYFQNINPGKTVDNPDQIKTEKRNEMSKSFSIIDIKVIKIDWLLLSASGHTRVKFTKDNNFNGEWIAP